MFRRSMRLGFIAVLIMLVAGAGAQSADAQAPAAQNPVAQEQRAINNVIAAIDLGFGKGDLQTVLLPMSTTVSGFGPNFNATGVEQVRLGLEPLIKGVKSSRMVAPPAVTMSGTLAYVAFRTAVERDPAAGPASSQLRWTLIIQKAADSRWGVLHFHLSEDPEAKK